MDIRVTNENNVAFMTLVGRFDELAARTVEAAFLQVAGEHPTRVIVDLSAVEYISSSGLRVLLMFSRALQNDTAELRLCGLSPFVAEVFEVGNLGSIFHIFPDSEAALSGFAER